MLKSIFIARYLIIVLCIPKKHAHFATHLRSEFYIVIIRARIQALLRQGGGIHSEHKNLHRSLILFVDSWPRDNLSVVFSESPFRLYLTGKQAIYAISYHGLVI